MRSKIDSAKAISDIYSHGNKAKHLKTTELTSHQEGVVALLSAFSESLSHLMLEEIKKHISIFALRVMTGHSMSFTELASIEFDFKNKEITQLFTDKRVVYKRDEIRVFSQELSLGEWRECAGGEIKTKLFDLKDRSYSLSVVGYGQEISDGSLPIYIEGIDISNPIEYDNLVSDFMHS